MTYETIDWEMEAKRIAVAFGSKGTCKFRPMAFPFNPGMELHRPRIWPFKTAIQCRSGVILSARYKPDGKVFSCQESGQALISFDWNNDAQHFFEWGGPSPKKELAEGLFYLHLLTAELEEFLGFSLSSHEKIELLQQFDERLKQVLL